MEREVAETLAYFRKNVSELKKLGKEWGLSDTEIEECVHRAMSADVKQQLGSKTEVSPSTTLKFTARKTWPKLRVFLTVAGVVLVLGCIGALALQNERVAVHAEQLLSPLMYPVFRVIRLIAVPLHAYPFTYDKYMEECLIDNPFFSGGDRGPDFCESCRSVEQVTEFTSESLENGTPPPIAFMEPLLFKGQGSIVSMKKMQEILSPVQLAWRPMPGIKTNLEWLSQVKDLMEPGIEEKLMAHPHFFFHWISKLTSTSQLMRKVFPRPAILGDKEVPLTKNVYVDGPAADSFTLRSSSFGDFSWYIQGWGKRRLVLTPTAECSDICNPVSITLQAGDLLTYNCELYHAEVFPAGDDISIAFLSQFDPL